MEEMIQLGERAKEVSRKLNTISMLDKKRGLLAVADALIMHEQIILKANQLDLAAAKEAGMKESLVDRLMLNSDRMIGISEGIRKVADLEDPVGEVLSVHTRPNGLQIGQKRVPLGVIGIIYESRPNVTADAFALCFKTGNAVILRGGSDAIHTNIAIVDVIQMALEAEGISKYAIQLVKNTSRDIVTTMMKMNDYIDVLIPRGGAGLIRNVIQNSTVPVIETGTGNCHIYIDEFGKLDMAIPIIVNAKTQRMGVCNACESLVIHSAIAKEAVPAVVKALSEYSVEIRGDERACAFDSTIVPATEEDWGTEYLDAILSLRIVDSIDEAITHINRYNTKHSEAIITENLEHAKKFLNEIDAAAVYVNASTRFTDGYEFGFGAEIGISTQKLHARGPMGLLALTTTKYIIMGDGQVRP